MNANNKNKIPSKLKRVGRPIVGVLEEVAMRPPMAQAIGLVCRNAVRIHGYHIHTDGLTPKVKAALFWGFYEAAELAFVQRHLLADLDVVELGTSIGVVACHALSRMNPLKRLICLEADPNLARMARQNLRSNHPTRRVEVLNCAIAYDCQTVCFEEGGTNLIGKVSKEGREVPAITLSGLLQKFHIDDYVLICDIEGAEAEILHKDPEALAYCRQMIIELHDGPTGSSHELVELLMRRFRFSVSEQYHPVYAMRCADR